MHKSRTNWIQESVEGVVDITDFDIILVEAMVHFMYHLDYDVPSEQSAMSFHATVYQIADKYDVQSLKQLARTKFSTTVMKLEGWDKAEFPSVISLVWRTTLPKDRGLRDIVATASYKNLAALMEKKAFIDELTANGPFAVEVIRLQRNGSSISRRYHLGFDNTPRYHCDKCLYSFDFGNKRWSSEDVSRLSNSGPTYCPMCRYNGVQRVM
ncbi:hypothetical protein NW766_004365 [Fusarium irregulare]|uniref:BTB domain-containing protein n=1 Tax=Fusarium irregulare TaxID=2494466 RepID=A0A9W8PSB1_9HYPO|nr:hypothetical protein NW766_004365 [Fusarium irregulare]